MAMIDPDRFYGRHETLEILRKRVIDFKDGYRQNVAILGDRYIGKTSTLHKFFSEIDQRDLIQIYINVENQDTSHFCRKLAASVLYQYAKHRRLASHEEAELLIEAVQDDLPLSARQAKRVLAHVAHGRYLEAYQEAIALPQVFAKESGLFCVVVLDEFHCLEEWDIPAVFQELGKTVMTQKQCLYIVSSSMPETAQVILSEKLSLLFGNFEVVFLEPFSIKTCHEYIAYHLGDVRISPALRDFLIDFTGGRPLYLRLLLEEIVHLSAVHRQQEVFLPLFTQAVERMIFNSWGVLTRHFDVLIDGLSSGRGNSLHTDILVALARGRRKVKDLARDIGVKQTALAPRLTRLAAGGYIVKNEKFFYIKDKLFRYWLTFVFQTRREMIDSDPQTARERFRAEFGRAFEEFKASMSQDVSTRIVELLHCFDDDAFLMNGRRYKLPSFDHVRSSGRLAGVAEPSFSLIEASASDGDWCVVLKEGAVCEHDIAEISSALKGRPQRPQRCVLIAFQDLDENVRVRALQERMWIWNESELKSLLNLYDKPCIL